MAHWPSQLAVGIPGRLEPAWPDKPPASPGWSAEWARQVARPLRRRQRPAGCIEDECLQKALGWSRSCLGYAQTGSEVVRIGSSGSFMSFPNVPPKDSFVQKNFARVTPLSVDHPQIAPSYSHDLMNDSYHCSMSYLLRAHNSLDKMHTYSLVLFSDDKAVVPPLTPLRWFASLEVNRLNSSRVA